MDQVKSLLTSWADREPTASLWLLVAMVLLFGAALARSRQDYGRAWMWGRHLLEALAQAMALAVLAGVAYFLLNSNYAGFNQVHGTFPVSGSLSNQAWQQEQERYGGQFVQLDLQVVQTVTVQQQETIQFDDPAKSPLYRYVQAEEPVMQNSIVGFRGLVTMELVNPAHPADTFNGFTLSAWYEYDIVNATDSETRVKFSFPLAADAKLYQHIEVKENGEEVSQWRVVGGQLVWDGQMSPDEKKLVSIHYVTSGTKGFYYEVFEQREVIDFSLSLTLDTKEFWVCTKPENGGVMADIKNENLHSTITWTIDRSILSPHLGVDLWEGWVYSPYHELMVTLPYAARALVLFLSLATVTQVIGRAPVNLRQLALLACLFVFPYLLLMTGAVPAPKTVSPAEYAVYLLKALSVISTFSLLLAFIILRKLQRLPLVLTLVLMALFLIGYPLVGLLPDEQQRGAAEGMIQAGMIGYVFGLALYGRVRSMRQSEGESRRLEGTLDVQ